MTTASEAYLALRARLEQNTPAGVTALRWQDEDEDSNGDTLLPEPPATFLYSEFLAGTSRTIEVGGGRGANRHRNPASFNIYVLVPRGKGLRTLAGDGSLDIANAIAGLFRSYSDAIVTVESATAYPGGSGADLTPKGLSDEAGNYFWSAVGVELYFDLIG